MCNFWSFSIPVSLISLQETYKDGGGLIWTQAPFGYSMALIIGKETFLISVIILFDHFWQWILSAGTFYARKMREAEYVTMIDPFTQKWVKKWPFEDPGTWRLIQVRQVGRPPGHTCSHKRDLLECFHPWSSWFHPPGSPSFFAPGIMCTLFP